jgi:dTDP-L-rhamnose 4-epimerase
MPDFSTFIHVNAYSTALLYELITEKRLSVEKIVLASSQAVYGEGKYLCEEHGIFYPEARALERLQRGLWEHVCPRCGRDLQPIPFNESVVNPHTAYGVSKYTQELIGIPLGKRYEISTVALRYSIVQGPRNSFYNAYSDVCRTFTQRMLNNKPPVIYEDGKQLRDYVHVKDAAAANLLVLQRPESDYEVFNVGGMRAVSVLDFARIVAAHCGTNIPPVIPGEFRIGDTRHTISDSAKLRSFGWTPRYSVEEVVKDNVDWVRNQSDIQDHYEWAAQEMKQRAVLRTAAVSA